MVTYLRILVLDVLFFVNIDGTFDRYIDIWIYIFGSV
jgi:hypothetical protein